MLQDLRQFQSQGGGTGARSPRQTDQRRGTDGFDQPVGDETEPFSADPSGAEADVDFDPFGPATAKDVFDDDPFGGAEACETSDDDPFGPAEACDDSDGPFAEEIDDKSDEDPFGEKTDETSDEDPFGAT